MTDRYTLMDSLCDEQPAVFAARHGVDARTVAQARSMFRAILGDDEVPLAKGAPFGTRLSWDDLEALADGVSFAEVAAGLGLHRNTVGRAWRRQASMAQLERRRAAHA